jgi:uncharacterized protein YodC (DUF2158 family)
MLPQSIKDEKTCYKPHLKYNLGDQVFLKSDKKRKFPMLITDFDVDEDYTSDYYCKWMNSQGSIEQECFPEECLLH